MSITEWSWDSDAEVICGRQEVLDMYRKFGCSTENVEPNATVELEDMTDMRI